MSEIKYLVVDDEARIIDLVSGHVQRKLKDPELSSALNGRDALEICDEKKFTFIITDFYMPGLSGVDLIQKIRWSEGPNATTPIILLSGYNPNLIAGQSSEVDKPLNWENVFFMDKPINMTQLDHYLNCCIKLNQ